MPPGQGKPDPDPDGPYPSVPNALMLTLMAVFAGGFTSVAFMDFGILVAAGIGQAIGVGAVATMGAQRVSEPQAARLGLRALDFEAIPMILCLVPAVLLASELDNIAADWSGETNASRSSVAQSHEADLVEEGGQDLKPNLDRNNTRAEVTPLPVRQPPKDTQSGIQNGAEAIAFDSDLPTNVRNDVKGTVERTAQIPGDGAETQESDDTLETGASKPEEDAPLRVIDTDDPVSILQAFVVIVGISPIIEEFLFRGVIQQGLVLRMGLLRGLSVVALLWSVLRLTPVGGFERLIAAAIASFALGWGLGLVRIATGSILGPMLLASSWAAVGLAATVFEGSFPLPGLNVEGTHLPVLVTLACLGIVGWAGWTLFGEAEKKFSEEAGIGGVLPDAQE